MKKWKLILFYIFTFGVGYFIVRKKAKEISKVENQELEISNNIPFNIDEFISNIGSSKNIEKVEATLSSLNVFYKDKIKNLNINYDYINSLKPKGIMKYEKKISFVFGDFSKKLCDEINKRIKNES